MSKNKRKAKVRRLGIRISACMMVKDEAENLPRCLESIKGLVDEIIVVDTGSTDNSIEICESYGAKVYRHPFEGDLIDDFSKYRNLSIGYASHNWVLIIDADEELIVKTSKTQFMKSMAKIPKNMHGVAFLFQDIQKGKVMMQTHSARIFKKDNIEYVDIIHNQPKVDGDISAVIEDLQIKHYGYDLSPEKMEKKRQRVEALLHKRIDQNKEDNLAYFFLMQHYAQYEQFDKAAGYAEEYLKRLDQAKREGHYMASVYYCAYNCYRELNDPENANRWLNLGLKALPDDLDMAMGLTQYGVWQRRADLTVLGAKRFIELYHRYLDDPSLKKNRFIFSEEPEGLLFCEYHYILVQLHELVQIFSDMKKAMELANGQFQENLSKDVESLLGRLGLEALYSKIIPERRIQTVRSIPKLNLKAV